MSNVHTTPSPDGDGWINKKEGNERASSKHDTKADAVERGRDLARNESSEHLIHKKDGTIGERNSYGNDPYPPKG